MRVPRAYRTATQRNKVKYERQLTNETYKVCHESRRTAGYVKRDLLFLVRKHVEDKRYQNLFL